MIKLTELLGKSVLSIYNCENEGIVKDVTFNAQNNKLKQIKIFKDNDFQEEKIFDTKNIYSLKDAVILKNDSYITLQAVEKPANCNLINNAVYSHKGEYIGQIKDVLLNEKFYVEKIVLNSDLSFLPSQILHSKDKLTIIQDSASKVRLYQFKHREISKPKLPELKVDILPINLQPLSANTIPTSLMETPQDNQKEETELVNPVTLEKFEPELVNESMPNNTETTTETAQEKTERKKIYFNQNSLPTKAVANSNYLLGRKTIQTIYANSNNEILIKKNTKITPTILDTAKKYNKVRELAIYSEK